MEEVLLYNAIVTWFDDAFEFWGDIDNPYWIEHVCEKIGITEEEYKRIMKID